MDRRSLLTWLGSGGLLGLGGCSNQEGAQPEPTPTGRQSTASPTASASPTQGTASDSPTSEGTGTATGTPSGDLQRTVSLTSVDTVPAGFEVEMHAELLRARVTDTQTVRLRITTTNPDSPRSISVAEDGCSLLNRSKGGSDRPAGLWLHHPGQAEHIDRDGNRWEADRSADEHRGYDGYACTRKAYAAGESVRNEYVLWSDYRVEGYMEPGTYRWEEEVSVTEDRTPTGTASERSFTWGFSLSVTEP